MKLSEWKAKHDKTNDSLIRAISLDELLSITEFDNQPERSKRENGIEVPYIPCKHTTIYYSFQKGTESDHYFDEVEFNDSDEAFTRLLKSFEGYEELSYWDLSASEREMMDKSWEQHAPMRCSEHCGNTVREVQ